jgi:site-specific DNA-methyltransferase (adenine-specific)
MSNIELIQGDCLEKMKDIPDKSVGLTVTSPPYDNLRTYGGVIDGWSFEKFQDIAKELYRITKDGGVVVWVVGDATINGSETGTSFKQALYFMECGFNLHDTMIYQKNGTGACGSNKCYWQTFEYMFVFSKGKIKTVNRLTNETTIKQGGSRIKSNGKKKIENRISDNQKKSVRSNVWLYNVGNANNDDKTNHPAVFPEQLANDHILSWSNENAIVFDPFMGSGTTGKMSILNNRNFIGIELNEEYFQIATQRVEEAKKNLTQQQMKLF